MKGTHTTLPLTESKPDYPSYREAFLFWLKLGFISFGGPAGQIGIMHEFIVEKKKWVSDSRFMHALNYCMLLPGPEAQQLATYLGWLLHGIRGGLTAGVLFILPSVFILLGLSMVYVTYGNLPWVAALFYGLKPAIVAIVVVALLKIASKSLISPFHYMIAMASFVLLFFLKIPFPYIILGSILLGIMVIRFYPSIIRKPANGKVVVSDEHQYIINNNTVVRTETGYSGMFMKSIFALLLWALPVIIVYVFSHHFDFWFTLIAFFTKSALITFGGAYAVLPYVAQVSVDQFQWLTASEMVDGLALGESTPGPLIMVLVFVGFMAGYRNMGSSLLAGSFGLVTTTFYTFLPSFLFILIGAPWVERTKENNLVKGVLGIITAAVVGVVLNLTIYFGKAVLITREGLPDWFSIFWTILSFIALYKFKKNMILWIGISSVAGLLYWFAFLRPDYL